jgi:hypothetical protein
MNNQEEKTDKEARRIEKLKAEEAKILTNDKARTQAYLVREQEIEKAQKLKEDQRNKDRASEEARELVKDKARKEAYQAREKAIAEDQEARRSKDKKID